MSTKLSPGLAATSTPGAHRQTQADFSKPPTKWRRVLAALLTGRSYNRFEAERELHDHCLHSTVATLQRMGVTVHRRYETIPGFMGCATEVCRYWLATESFSKARELLEDPVPTVQRCATLEPFDANTGAS